MFHLIFEIFNYRIYEVYVKVWRNGRFDAFEILNTSTTPEKTILQPICSSKCFS